jgi:quercetin dioxygenase-like cupin family protein
VEVAGGFDGKWPKELDAVTADPAHHRLVLENERVRVLDTVVPAGANTPVHTHRWPAVEYVLSTANFVCRNRDGQVVLDTRTAGGEPRPSEVVWADPLPPHQVENVGDTEMRIITVELKDPR